MFENFQPQVTLWPRQVQGWLNECLKTNVLTSPNGQSVTKLFFKQPLIRSTRSCDRLIFCFKCIHRLRRSQFRCTVSITIILCGAFKECGIVQKFCTIQRSECIGRTMQLCSCDLVCLIFLFLPNFSIINTILPSLVLTPIKEAQLSVAYPLPNTYSKSFWTKLVHWNFHTVWTVYLCCWCVGRRQSS